MKYKMVFAPEVKIDIQDAIEWYNNHQGGLGKRYLNELKKHSKDIQKSPESIAIRYNDSRCYPLKRFPYMIHFRLDTESNTIFIDAVFHISRNPEIWVER